MQAYPLDSLTPDGACLRPRGWAGTPTGHPHAPLPRSCRTASVGTVNTLTAWEFHDPSGAAQALKRVQALATQGMIRAAADLETQLVRSALDPDQERRLRAALAD